MIAHDRGEHDVRPARREETAGAAAGCARPRDLRHHQSVHLLNGRRVGHFACVWV
jgi:hypothetical protein